jgi:hypothetical protein
MSWVNYIFLSFMRRYTIMIVDRLFTCLNDMGGFLDSNLTHTPTCFHHQFDSQRQMLWSNFPKLCPNFPKL